MYCMKYTIPTTMLKTQLLGKQTHKTSLTSSPKAKDQCDSIGRRQTEVLNTKHKDKYLENKKCSYKVLQRTCHVS